MNRSKMSVDGDFSKHDDFRSRRMKLGPEDFALSSGEEMPPTDLIPEKTWKSMVSLTDDVSLRTSDHYGSRLARLWDLWGEWISLITAIQQSRNPSLTSPLEHVAFGALEDFEASIHNALVGFYRIAFASLRSVIENTAIGLQFELSGDRSAFSDWLSGRSERKFGFGWAADQLPRHPHVGALEEALKAATGDDLFHQRSNSDQGGFIRGFFTTLSNYTHAAPNYADGDIWKSNGPVFVRTAFEEWSHAFLTAYAFAVLQVRLAQPPNKKIPLDSRCSLRQMFINASAQLPAACDSRRMFDAVPMNVW